MTRTDKIKLARQLRAQGNTWEKVASELMARGVVREDGQPLTKSGAYNLADSKMKIFKNKRQTAASMKQSSQPHSEQLTLIKAILQNHSMTAEEKIAMAQMACGI